MLAKYLVPLCLAVSQIDGHGMMLEPAGRSSLWKTNSAAPRNYNDNQVFCGGYYVQYDLNGGKCGVCGDDWTQPHPQDNENGGTYGRGIIARRYQSGAVADVMVNLTKNHLGSFHFSLCELTDPNAPESGEDCFKKVKLADGSDAHIVTAEQTEVNLQLQLPEIKCERCVLRWHYRTGNNWGICETSGQWGPGCGDQETFRSCADIALD